METNFASLNDLYQKILTLSRQIRLVIKDEVTILLYLADLF